MIPNPEKTVPMHRTEFLLLPEASVVIGVFQVGHAGIQGRSGCF